MSGPVLFRDVDAVRAARLVRAYGATLVVLEPDAPIPGSYWGAPEAGLVGDYVYVRPDTPAHSLLHELCHYVCMDDVRRATLDTDAGGDDLEECGVCYLQLLLAEELGGFDLERSLRDMDAWGYSFREGSARAWFEGDARFAREWLLAQGLIDAGGAPTFRRRGSQPAENYSLVGFGASP
jgi:hypothetical protein